MFENFGQPLASRELRLRGLVELIGAELGERREFAVLRKVEPQRPGHLPHGFDLRVAADAAHRKTHVDRGPDAAVEQVGFEINLPVGNGNHVGRNVGRDVARLRLDDGQRGERARAQLVVQLRGALQQTRVEIEHVARKRFAPGRTAQQQRDFAVGLRVFRKVVVEADGVAAGIAEKLAHRAGGIRRDVLQRCGFGGRRRDDDGVVHRARIGQNLHHLRDRRALLPDRAVDANHVAALLVQDRVQNDGGLAGLAVADDQLALPAADRNHRVDGLDAGLQRLAHRLPVHNARSDALDRDALDRWQWGPCRRAAIPTG